MMEFSIEREQEQERKAIGIKMKNKVRGKTWGKNRACKMYCQYNYDVVVVHVYGSVLSCALRLQTNKTMQRKHNKKKMENDMIRFVVQECEMQVEAVC